MADEPEVDEVDEVDEVEESEAPPAKKTTARRPSSATQEKRVRQLMREEARGALEDWLKENKPTGTSRVKPKSGWDWFSDMFGM